MFEDYKTTAVTWRNTATLPEITVDTETVAAACESLRKTWDRIAASFEVVAEGFRKWILSVAAAVEAQHEMEMALRWASVDNRPLYNRYRHTKKERIRKKDAKRILEWYRTEVAPC